MCSALGSGGGQWGRLWEGQSLWRYRQVFSPKGRAACNWSLLSLLNWKSPSEMTEVAGDGGACPLWIKHLPSGLLAWRKLTPRSRGRLEEPTLLTNFPGKHGCPSGWESRQAWIQTLLPNPHAELGVAGISQEGVNNNSWHLLNTYYAPGTVRDILYPWAHFIPTTPWSKFYVQRKLPRREEKNLLTETQLVSDRARIPTQVGQKSNILTTPYTASPHARLERGSEHANLKQATLAN